MPAEYKLKDLIPVPQIQALLDTLNETCGIPSAIMDMEGNILTASGWQDICVNFHRKCPATEQFCKNSDLILARGVAKTAALMIHECYLGLTDSAIPIVVDDQHLGVVFTGQFFTREPDKDRFTQQARQFGFDEKAYLEALARVPVISEERFKKNLKFLVHFAEMLASRGLQHKRQLEIQSRIKKSDALYRDLAENSEDLVWQSDAEGRYTYLNPAWEKTFGYPISEMLGRRFSDFQEPEAAARDDRGYLVLLKRGSVRGYEATHRGRNGRIIHLIFNAKVVFDENGEIAGTRGTAINISERKRVEEALRKQNALMNTMLENLPIGIFMVSVPDGVPLIANEHAKRIMGRGIMPSATRENLSEVYRAYRAGTQIRYPTSEMPIVMGMVGKFGHIDDMEVEKPDGSRALVEIIGCPVRDDQGKIWASLVGFLDITERKAAEQAIIESKETAERASRMKSQFLDVAAHELRTPITAFSLMVQVAQKRVEQGHVIDQAFLARLRVPVNRLSRLVSDLLDLSRLERNMVSLRRERTDVVQLISESMEEFRLQSPERNFIFTSPSQAVELELDPIRINQVLSNLLDNANKYTPPGRPIEVSLERRGGVVRVSVIDQGAGISAELKTRLFSGFSRGTSEATVRSSGLGLGLSVCRELIQLHGGKIDFISQEGQGSTFYFELS